MNSCTHFSDPYRHEETDIERISYNEIASTLMSTQKKTAENSQPEEFITKQRGRTMRSVRVGMFFVASLALLLLLVFALGDRYSLFGNTFKLTSYFQNVEGLKTGAAVFVNGIRVGSVDAVQLAADTVLKVRVDMTIEGQYQPMITTKSIAKVGQVGFVGDKILEIATLDVNAPPVQDGSEIPGAAPVNYLAILDEANEAVENATNITASLDTLFLRFRRGEGTLGKLLTDDALYENLVDVSGSVEDLFGVTSAQFAEMSTTLRRTAENVDAITMETNNLLRDLGQGKGTVGALLYDRALYDSLESLVGTLNLTANNAGMAAREFGINMRGLRSNWLVGGLFNGGEEKDRDVSIMQKELEIRREELRRQEALLDKREAEVLFLRND